MVTMALPGVLPREIYHFHLVPAAPSTAGLCDIRVPVPEHPELTRNPGPVLVRAPAGQGQLLATAQLSSSNTKVSVPGIQSWAPSLPPPPCPLHTCTLPEGPGSQQP